MAERQKGTRLQECLDDYAVIDIETTDRSIYDCEIIELSAVKVRSNKIVDEFSTLVSISGGVPTEITILTGITDDMLKGQPPISEALGAYLKFLDGETLIGHNINTFDLNILYDKNLELTGKKLNNTYLDTLYFAKHCSIDCVDYRLATLCSYFGVINAHAHRALDDCRATHLVYQQLKPLFDGTPPSKSHKKSSQGSLFNAQTVALQNLEKLIGGITCDNVLDEQEVYSLKSWLDDNVELAGQYPYDKAMQAVETALDDGVLTQEELTEMLAIFKSILDPVGESTAEVSSTSDLSGKNICLTGEFDRGQRSAVEAYLTQQGAVVKSSVTKKLDILLVGSKGSSHYSMETYGGKVKRAMELNAKGANIQVIREKDFFS